MADFFETTSKYTRYLIFGYLKVQDLCPLLFLSKKMYKYVIDYANETKSLKIKDSDISRLIKSLDFRSFFTTFPKMNSLKINAFNITPEIFQYLPRHLVNLTLLNCKESLLRSASTYSHILQRTGDTLKNLKLEYNEEDKEYGYTPRDFLDSIVQFASGLKSLLTLAVHIIFKGSHKYSTQSLTNLLFYTFHQHSPKLEFIHFNYLITLPSTPRPNLTIKSIKVETSDGYAPKFEEANIFFGINSSTINFLATKFANLDEVIITDHLAVKKSLTDELVSNLISKHPQLKALCLNSYSDKFSVPDTCILHTVSSLHSLRRLGFASCKNFCVSSILSVTNNFLNIRHLNLDFTDLDDNDVFHMTELIEKVEFLSLKCCFKISEEGYAYLCEHLYELRIANFKYVKALTSEALENLVSTSKNLKKLKLANNFLSNDDFFSILHNVKNLSDLTWSAMNSSDQVSQECFYRCLEEKTTCWRLKNLDLNQNESLTDLSIEHLCMMNFPNITTLSLHRCRNITKVSLDVISRSQFRNKLITLNFSIDGVIFEKGEFIETTARMKKLASISIYNCQRHLSFVELTGWSIEITLL